MAYGYGLQTYERDRDAQKGRNDVVMVLDNALSFTGHILERATTRGAFAIADGTPPFLYLFFSFFPPSFLQQEGQGFTDSPNVSRSTADL